MFTDFDFLNLCYCLTTTLKRKERVFEELYKSQKDFFVMEKRHSFPYFDFRKEQRDLEDLVEMEANFPQNKGFFKSLLQTFNKQNAMALALNIIEEFDPTLAEREFDQLYQERLEFFNGLPEKIKKKVSDPKIFCLGYATKREYKFFRNYAEKRFGENLPPIV